MANENINLRERIRCKEFCTIILVKSTSREKSWEHERCRKPVSFDSKQYEGLKRTLRKSWFKGIKLGVNKLGWLMNKAQFEKAKLENWENTCIMLWKTMLHPLSDQEVSLNDKAQLYGHKNFKSIEKWSLLSTKQQQFMSTMLANIYSEKAIRLPNAVACNPLLLELRTLAQL